MRPAAPFLVALGLLACTAAAWSAEPSAARLAQKGKASTEQAEEAKVRPTGDPEAGRTLAETACASCHGTDGNTSNDAWPKIAGQLEEHLYKQLVDYRDDRRPDAYMQPPVKDLTDQQLADLSAWYASQKPTPSPQNPQLAQAGRELWFDGRPDQGIPPCVGCHGSRGRGLPGVIDGGFPAVHSQNAGYSLATMLAYKEGRRTNDHNGMMQAAVRKLSDEDLRALAELMATPL